MQDYPHHYKVAANSSTASFVQLSSEGLPDLESAPPSQFGGPGDHWSPETLLVAAVADCFVLSFKAIARASKFDWVSLSCDVEGILDREEKTTRFVAFKVHANLRVAEGANVEKAQRLLEKSEHACLITNSLSGESELSTTISTAG